MSEDRCAGCGKPLVPEQAVSRISLGTYIGPDNSIEESEVWGILHRNCFRSIVRSPEMTLERIKELSQSNT